MKIHAISPLYPSVVIRLDTRLESIRYLYHVWFMFCRDKNQNLHNLEVELCGLRFGGSKFFTLYTELSSVLQDCTKESVLLSIDLKDNSKMYFTNS